MKNINGIYKYYFKTKDCNLLDAPRLWNDFNRAYQEVNESNSVETNLEKPFFVELLESIK